MDRSIKIIVALCATFAGAGCDSGKGKEGDKDATVKVAAAGSSKSETTEASKKASAASAAAPAKPANTAKKAKAEPEAPAGIVLEEAELKGLGKLLMPEGYKPGFVESHWKYDLGDFKSLNVSWEPQGAKSLKKAKSMSKILGNAETVKASKTLDNGFHEIERVRQSDGYTFVVVFSDTKYVKCVAPAEEMESCRSIVRSMT